MTSGAEERRPKAPRWVWGAFITLIVLIILPLAAGIALTIHYPGYSKIAIPPAPDSREGLRSCHAHLDALTDELTTHLFSLSQAMRLADEKRAEQWQEDIRLWREDLETVADRCRLTEPRESLPPALAELSEAYRALRELQEGADGVIRDFAVKEEALLSRAREALSRAKVAVSR